MSMKALRKFEELPPWTGPTLTEPEHRLRLAPPCAFNSRDTATHPAIDTFVIHATAGSSSSGAMSVSKACKASWHWLVPDENEDGHGQYVWACVPESKKAWHVLRRVKFRPDGKRDINSRALGVEIVNAQTGRDPFSDWQLRVTAALVNYARSKYPIRYLYTHAWVDPRRKLDPGEPFDWNAFMGYIREGETAEPPTPWPPWRSFIKDETGLWVEIEVLPGGDHREDFLPPGKVFWQPKATSPETP